MKIIIPLLFVLAAGTAGAREIQIEDCPAPVRETLLTTAAGGVIDDIERIVRKGETIYVAEIDGPGARDAKFRISTSGEVLFQSEDVELRNCPKAVRKAIRKQLRLGWTVDDIDRQERGGDVRFRVEIDRIHNRDLIFVISERGKVLKHKPERYEDA
jgi:hypothetical protein